MPWPEKQRRAIFLNTKRKKGEAAAKRLMHKHGYGDEEKGEKPKPGEAPEERAEKAKNKRAAARRVNKKKRGGS